MTIHIYRTFTNSAFDGYQQLSYIIEYNTSIN